MKNRLKTAAATVGVAAVSALVPLTQAAPAEADTEFQGCTVGPEAPYYAGFDDDHHVPYVYYPIHATCTAGLSVEIEQKRWEEDREEREGVISADEDYLGSSVYNWDFPNGGVKSIRVQRTLPWTGEVEGRGEEVYSTIRFRVTSTQVTGPWTAIEYSPVTWIAH